MVMADGKTMMFGPRDDVQAALKKANEEARAKAAAQAASRRRGARPCAGAATPGSRDMSTDRLQTRRPSPRRRRRPAASSSAASSAACCGPSGASSLGGPSSAWSPTC